MIPFAAFLLILLGLSIFGFFLYRYLMRSGKGRQIFDMTEDNE